MKTGFVDYISDKGKDVFRKIMNQRFEEKEKGVKPPERRVEKHDVGLQELNRSINRLRKISKKWQERGSAFEVRS